MTVEAAASGSSVESIDTQFTLVVWAGWWADVEYRLGGEVDNFAPEFTDVDGARAAVIGEVQDLLA